MYTHFNSLKKKVCRKTLLKKCEIAHFRSKRAISHFFHNVFQAIRILKSFNTTFQLSSAASLNLGRSQNVVLGNGLSTRFKFTLYNVRFMCLTHLHKDLISTMNCPNRSFFCILHFLKWIVNRVGGCKTPKYN